ncbi:hypothetical protein [Streptomyces sp. NPDC056399]|uniref:hypothetical protein n=1 Tax=Streptomyces sp. NPDC056399 TaxID=3345807 RepID=UPI0035DD6DA1
MNHLTPPRLKSHTQTTNELHAAEQPVAPVAVGARRVVAEGVPVSSDLHPAHCLSPLLTEGEAA